MTDAEFKVCMAVLVGAAGKPMPDPQLKVYFELLSDLPVEALFVACKRAVIENAYPNIPPIGTIRRMAVSAMHGQCVELTAGEAWSIALRACGNCDVEVEGSVERAFAKIPPLVWRAVEAFGFRALYDIPGNSLETARAQFMRIYESLLTNEERLCLLPASIREEIALLGKRHEQITLSAPVAKALTLIGVEES